MTGASIPVSSLAANIGALDVWGWVAAGVEVCITGSGSLFFVDSANIPKTAAAIADAYSRDGMTCALLTRVGSLVLMPGPAAPAQQTPADPPQALSGCTVRANDILNLRASPGGAIIGAVANNSVLTAISRAAGWFQVDAISVTGWLSADYVTPIGTCG